MSNSSNPILILFIGLLITVRLLNRECNFSSSHKWHMNPEDGLDLPRYSKINCGQDIIYIYVHIF